MLVGVDIETKRILKTYGFSQLLKDHDLKVEDVLQILIDHGYIDIEVYEEND